MDTYEFIANMYTQDWKILSRIDTTISKPISKYTKTVKQLNIDELVFL